MSYVLYGSIPADVWLERNRKAAAAKHYAEMKVEAASHYPESVRQAELNKVAIENAAKTTAEMAAAVMAAINFGTFDFGEAIKRLKEGDGVARAGWNGKGLWLEYVKACGNQLAHVRLHYPGGTDVPWAPSQTDMLAEDWFVV